VGIDLVQNANIVQYGTRSIIEPQAGRPWAENNLDRGDRVQLQQVILNLLTNAFYAMKDCPLQDREVVCPESWTEQRGDSTGGA
jgi:C4-dicarboxylate-specific signal transduction histidine kinase